MFKVPYSRLFRDIFFCSALCMYSACTAVDAPSPPSDYIRLLDVSALSTSSGLDLTMVLEYIDQDLSTYLSAVPASGLSRHKIKVSTLSKVDDPVSHQHRICLMSV